MRKQSNKQKALALLENGKELGNEEIREELKVSRQSVNRYMNELEKTRQGGASGRQRSRRYLPPQTALIK